MNCVVLVVGVDVIAAAAGCEFETIKLH